MTKVRFTEEFKQEAVRQMTERGRSVFDVSAALAVSTHSLYAWQRRYEKPVATSAAEAEVKRP